jgi:hypothetical protein
LSDFIVVRVSGEAIGRSGGRRGMSRAPRRQQAIRRAEPRRGWSKEITPIGLVTPIEPMLAVLDSAKTAAALPDPDSILADVRVVERAFAPSAADLAASPDAIFAYPVSTPLLASGLSTRALEALMGGAGALARPRGTLRDVLPPHALAPEISGLASLSLSLAPMAGAAAAPAPTSASLVPGGALGVALVSGDISLGALGTVTYVEGDRPIGFRHRSSSTGSAFPLTTVSIIDTMKALDASFKQDSADRRGQRTARLRSEARSGERRRPSASVLGREPRRPRGRTLLARLVDERGSSRSRAHRIQAVDSVLDRVGPGTVEVTYQISGSRMPGSLERKDVFAARATSRSIPWQLARSSPPPTQRVRGSKITDVSASCGSRAICARFASRA